MSRLRTLLVGAALVANASQAHADITITPKHLIILRPGVDTIWGSYVFAVQNTDEAEAELKSQIMLPKEMVDFMPQEGLEPEQVTLSPGGGVQIDAKFPKGVHVVSIGFKVDASFGGGKLTFAPTNEVQSFTVLIPRDQVLTVESPILTRAAADEAPDPQYIALTATEPLAAGRTYVVGVGGIPEGRQRLWILGSVVGGLALLLAGLLAIRTRPKITQDAGDSVLVG